MKPPGYVDAWISIELKDENGEVITEEIGGLPSSQEITMSQQKDCFKALHGNGEARVNIGIDESIGGPYGYSSVRVKVMVGVSCNQDKDTIGQTEKLLFEECLGFLDLHLPTAYTMLTEHLKHLYSRE